VSQRHNIVACCEGSFNALPPPSLLASGGVSRVVNRTVLSWSPVLGSYGMGGPGFFGLNLEAAGNFPREWLVLTLWSACSWLLLDGKWIDAHPRYHPLGLPLYIDYGGESDRDEVTAMLVGGTIVDASMEVDSSLLVLETQTATRRLEIPQDPGLLSRFGGTDLPRVWYEDEDQRGAWVISHGQLFL
jgi:hypothetical protein